MWVSELAGECWGDAGGSGVESNSHSGGWLREAPSDVKVIQRSCKRSFIWGSTDTNVQLSFTKKKKANLNTQGLLCWEEARDEDLVEAQSLAIVPRTGVVDEFNNTLALVSVRECIQGEMIESHEISPGYKRLPMPANQETTSAMGSGTD